jgi:hypothetical protein
VEKNKISIANFVKEDGFELNSYLTYLFNQIYDYLPKHVEEKTANE